MGRFQPSRQGTVDGSIGGKQSSRGSSSMPRASSETTPRTSRGRSSGGTIINAVSILVGGVIPAEAAGCCGRAADQRNALAPVRVINVDLADLVFG